jgi:hypothetical protein
MQISYLSIIKANIIYEFNHTAFMISKFKNGHLFNSIMAVKAGYKKSPQVALRGYCAW